MNASTTFQFGNKEITITAQKGSVWEKEGISRGYFDVQVQGKANPLHKLYEVIEGTTRDKTAQVNGRTFGYVYGFCDSKSKMRAVDEAVLALVSQL